MKQKHRKIKDVETVNYTLKIPENLHTDIKEIAYKKSISMAYLMQTAIEEYVEKIKKQ